MKSKADKAFSLGLLDRNVVRRQLFVGYMKPIYLAYAEGIAQRIFRIIARGFGFRKVHRTNVVQNMVRSEVLQKYFV